MTQLGLSGDWCYTSVFSESVKKGGHLPKEGKRRGLQGSKCSPWRWEGFSWETGPGFPETFPGLVHSACTCAHTHTRTNMYTCVHTCTSTCMCTRHARTCAIHTCAHAYTYAHACTHARTHTHTHTHTHTYPFPNLNLISLRQLRSQTRLQTCLLGRPSLGYPLQTHSCLGFRARGALRWFHKTC